MKRSRFFEPQIVEGGLHSPLPHRSFGHLTTNESVVQRQVIWAAEETVCSS